MDITINRKSANEASIKINLKEADYQPKVDEKIKDFSKKANIKGFRPGKVPASVVRNMYGKSIMVEEINHILSHALTDYIREEKLNVLGDPLPDREQAAAIDWDNQKEFDFEYRVGLVDEFDVKLDKKIKVTGYQITVDDKAMDKTIDELQRQYGKMSNPEKSEEGDLLYGEFRSESGGIEHKTSVFIDDVAKKERKKFIGVGPGDKLSIDPAKTFEEEHTLEGLVNKRADEVGGLKDLEFDVINVNRKEPAELNQEFFDQLFGPEAVKSEEEFRAKVKEVMEQNYKRDSDQFLDREIRDEVIKKNQIDLPDDFLKEWLFISNEEKVTREQIDTEYAMYADELKWSLISNKIAEVNEVKVSAEDVTERARELIRGQLASSGLGAQMDEHLDSFVENYLQAEEGKNYAQVYNMLKGEKVFGVIRDAIQVSEKKVSPDDFKKKAEQA